MSYYLIVCRSITHAQRIAALLERGGIRVRMIRTPKTISTRGCSHSVRISEKNTVRAGEILSELGLEKEQVYRVDTDGTFQEAEL